MRKPNKSRSALRTMSIEYACLKKSRWPDGKTSFLVFGLIKVTSILLESTRSIFHAPTVIENQILVRTDAAI